MFLNAKEISFLGILLAIDTILLILSGVIEINTLFLLAMAAFCVGIVIREFGIKTGIIFLVASILLGYIFAPVKIYCITYLVMASYILLSEIMWNMIAHIENDFKRDFIFWILRFLAFNIIYIPCLIYLPKIIYLGIISKKMKLMCLVGGQFALVIFEIVYCRFHIEIWDKLKKYVM